MLVIRLTRVGKKKQPSYRMVVQEKTQDPWGKAKDYVGFYNPLSKPKTVKIENEKVLEWIRKGAQPSPTVHNLLVNAGVIKADKVRNTTGDKDVKKAERAAAAEEAAKAAEEAAKAAAEEPKAEETPAESPAEEAPAEAPAEEAPAEEKKEEAAE